MEYIKFGDYKVSRVAFGCYAMGGYDWGEVSDIDSITAVQCALDKGINFFDTADVYGLGHSEKVLAKALGAKRHDAVIATKFGLSWDKNASISNNCSATYVVNALENSLKRLKLDCIPLYQIHWPDPSVPFEETMAALLKCKQQGKVRHIGCSNFNCSQIENINQYGDILSLQTQYSLVDREFEDSLSDYCLSKEISVLAYGALVKGLLSGKFNSSSSFAVSDLRHRDTHFQGEEFKHNLKIADVVRVIAEKYKKTMAQVALRWVLDSPSVSCVIAGIKTTAQLNDNVGVFGWSLKAQDYDLLLNSVCHNV